MEKKNASDFPKFYYTRHMTAGLCGYEDETILVDVAAINKLALTFNGKPVYIQHQDVDLDTMKQEAVGYIVDTFYDMDGWLWSKMMITDDEGHAVIANGTKDHPYPWAVSNAYIPNEWGNGGTKNNLPYDREVLNGDFTHLALVPNPRYEDAKIYTPEQYQARNTQLLNSLAHSKKTEETKGITMKFFKTKKEEVSDIDSATSVELKNDKGETIEVTVEEMVKTIENSKKAAQKFKVGNTEMTLAEIEKAYLNAKKNESESDDKKDKENESDDDEEKDNESDDDKEGKENESDDDDEDEKGEKKNSQDDHFEKMKNAEKRNSGYAVRTLDTRQNGLARAKARYGSAN
jgi:hypothetical protein